MIKRPVINRHTLVYAAGALIAVAAISLALLQYRWIADSNQSERERELRSIRISIERSLEELGNELRALVSFAYIPPDDPTYSVDLDGIAHSIDVWSEQADDAELLRRLYVIQAGDGATFEIADGSYKQIEVPDQYASLAGFQSTTGEQSSYLTSLMADGVLVMPFDMGEAGKESVLPSTNRYMVIELDLHILFNSVLPGYMESYLPGYSYRIVQDEKIRYVRGDADFESRRPDARYPLFLPLMGGFIGLEERSDSLQAKRWPDDPLSRFWILRRLSVRSFDWGNVAFEENPDRPGDKRISVSTPDAMVIEIFYPNGSIGQIMKRRMFGDLAVSYGFLLLFLGAIFGLLAVYRRSEKFRIREREFVSAMSHELRTPVSVIRSISENLADGVAVEPDRLTEYGGLIREQSHRLGRMIESILMVSGLNQNAVTRVELSSTNIASIIDEVARMLEPAALELGVSIVQEIDTHIGEFLTDRVALRLILENLLMNAIRHGRMADKNTTAYDPEQAQVVLVRARVVTDLDPESKWYRYRKLRIEIEDEGPGIPGREQRHVFDAFYRGLGTRNNQIPGSGLGLHLVRRVIRLIRGDVSIESPYMRKDVRVQGVRVVAEISEGKEPTDG